VASRLLILDTELEMGGKEKLLYQFIERTDPNRFRIAVCCLRPGGYYRERIRALGVPFYDGLLRHRYDALAFRSLAQIIRSERTEIIETFAHPNTVIFSFLARQQKMVERVVVSYHATGSAYNERVLARYIVPLLRRMDAHLAVAESQKRYLVGVEGLPERRVRVIYNGVDTERYRPATPDERAAARRALGVPGAGVVLMVVGSLKPVKGIDVLIRAAAPILRARADTRLVLVGDGPDRDALRALAGECGVAGSVVFAGVRDEIEVVLRAADTLVLSSRSEALPTVVIEAMACALPVVATRVGGVPELVEPEKSAILVPPDDEAALRAALRRVADSPDLRRALGARGRETAVSRFRLERMCEERQSFFEELLSAPAARGDGLKGRASS
jgi:glycosyltransferase involved in cell wall biosynthesis